MTARLSIFFTIILNLPSFIFTQKVRGDMKDIKNSTETSWIEERKETDVDKMNVEVDETQSGCSSFALLSSCCIINSLVR